MDNILISVIVPIHDTEIYLPQCIESILNQTYPYLQIILIDNGSTDGSGEICDRYAAIDNRIEVVHQRDMGATGARKSGLQKARGRYIGFVDSDDYIEPQMYERFLEEILASGADFVHFGYWEERIEKSEKKNVLEKQVIKTDEKVMEYIKESLLEEKNCMSPSMWSKLYNAEFIKSNFLKVPNECSYGEDKVCLFRCMLEANSVALVDEAYYHYRIRNGSEDRKYDLQKIMKTAILYDNLCRVFIEN